MRKRNNIFAEAFRWIKKNVEGIKYQKDLAARIGVSEDTITRMLTSELGKTKRHTLTWCLPFHSFYAYPLAFALFPLVWFWLVLLIRQFHNTVGAWGLLDCWYLLSLWQPLTRLVGVLLVERSPGISGFQRWYSLERERPLYQIWLRCRNLKGGADGISPHVIASWAMLDC